jgi:hypothetical protein
MRDIGLWDEEEWIRYRELSNLSTSNRSVDVKHNGNIKTHVSLERRKIKQHSTPPPFSPPLGRPSAEPPTLLSHPPASTFSLRRVP